MTKPGLDPLRSMMSASVGKACLSAHDDVAARVYAAPGSMFFQTQGTHLHRAIQGQSGSVASS
ncbi:hypothetical protein [Endozoicomonas sp. SESOKO1]|uniref:hypothetical protein n=1 Tax=Endozoicomonas sp. SESOKO1 TaxID=2828742 RepID=UPI00214849B1|nr:hypothetical protein [Endozoicomonas sp. SESOKO1]